MSQPSGETDSAAYCGGAAHCERAGILGQAIYQRLRDPIHDLVEIEDSKFGRAIWSLLESRPFQRLRRIKQLGFSDLVYPGATHSRFAHSVGVFHTARILADVLENKLGEVKFDRDRAEVSICAALIHDVGHGPFSHAFEGALGEPGRHERFTELLVKDGDISEILNGYRSGLSEEVASLFKSETQPDIYSSIVSSQFDADRLDYMRRDRYMAGTQSSSIDFTWLMSNLEVEGIEVGADEKQFSQVQTFVLGPKAGWAGEAYVLALFHLYPTVYLHKSTRGAEKLFGRMLQRIDALVRTKKVGDTGLPSNHPIVAYLRKRSLGTYLDLDDSVVLGALPLLGIAKDAAIAKDANRLRQRRLLKAVDVRNRLSDGRLYPGDEVEQKELAFRRALKERQDGDESLVNRILIDRFERNPYKRKGYDSPKAIERIHVLSKGHPVDLANISPVVDGLKPLQIYRVYVEPEDDEAKQLVESLIAEASK